LPGSPAWFKLDVEADKLLFLLADEEEAVEVSTSAADLTLSESGWMGSPAEFLVGDPQADKIGDEVGSLLNVFLGDKRGEADR